MANISDEEVAQIFSKFDKNGDGKLSAAETSQVLVELNCPATPEMIRSVMDDIDKDKDGYIDLQEFTEFLRRRDDKEAEILREAFDMFDLDRNGEISASELQAMLRRLGENHSLKQCEDMIKRVNGNGNDNVSFEDFKKMMNR